MVSVLVLKYLGRILVSVLVLKVFRQTFDLGFSLGVDCSVSAEIKFRFQLVLKVFGLFQVGCQEVGFKLG